MKQEQTIEQRPANSTYKKLAVKWLNDPDSNRDCAPKSASSQSRKSLTVIVKRQSVNN
jgi:hypothetical protein